MKANPNLQNNAFTTVHVGSRTHLLASEIIMVEADINYCQIYLFNGRKVITSTNMLKLENRMRSFENLVRVHRSCIINTEYLTGIEGTKAQLINNIDVTISRRRRDNLFQLLQNIS